MQMLDVFSWLRRRVPSVTLRIHVGIECVCTRSIKQFPLVLGRSEEADLHLPDTYVSRTHCLLAMSHGRIVLRDLESRHGTWINGRQMNQKVLEAGDQIAIGTSWIEVLSVAID